MRGKRRTCEFPVRLFLWTVVQDTYNRISHRAEAFTLLTVNKTKITTVRTHNIRYCVRKYTRCSRGNTGIPEKLKLQYTDVNVRNPTGATTDITCIPR